LIKQAKQQLTGGQLVTLSAHTAAPILPTGHSHTLIHFIGHKYTSDHQADVPAESSTVPPYEEFKIAFEEFLVQMNLGKEREEMLKLPTEQKWMLLQRLAGVLHFDEYSSHCGVDGERTSRNKSFSRSRLRKEP
jgi:hypothetical protein